MTTKEPLALPFPMPTSERIRAAYWNLYLSENGTDAQKGRLGDATLLPRPWDIATCIDPDLRRDVWEWYEDVVTWFNHEYVWDPAAGLIPPCWPQHPHLIHDIGVLADQRRRAGIDPTSSALEEWHRYGVPGFLERLKTRTKNGCDEHHAVWPMQARYSRHTGRSAAAARRALFDADAADLIPRSPATELSRRPPVLHVVRTKTGDLVDPVTGEAF